MSEARQSAKVADLDQIDDLIRVLMLIRSGKATTRPELSRMSGLGRSAISQRVAELIESGLAQDGRRVHRPAAAHLASFSSVPALGCCSLPSSVPPASTSAWPTSAVR